MKKNSTAEAVDAKKEDFKALSSEIENRIRKFISDGKKHPVVFFNPKLPNGWILDMMYDDHGGVTSVDVCLEHETWTKGGVFGKTLKFDDISDADKEIRTAAEGIAFTVTKLDTPEAAKEFEIYRSVKK